MVKRYIAALNARDADAAAAIYSDDCCLVDSTGGSVQGRGEASAATRAFFDLEANFHLDYNEITVRGDTVLIRGRVQADDRRLANNSLWEARVEEGKLSHWQSFGKGGPCRWRKS